MNVRGRIRQKITEKGYSIRQVGRITNVSHVTISNFLDGKKIIFENFIKIINGLDFFKQEAVEIVKKYELEIFNKEIGFNFINFNEINEMKLRLKELEKAQEIGELPNKIPVYSCVSAGTGYIPDAEPVDWISMNNGENLKGVIISGQSMEPTILDKSIIFFKEDAEVKNGEVGIFLVDGEGYIKRFFRNKNIVILDSDNRDSPPIMVDEYSDFKICGKVVKVLSDI